MLNKIDITFSRIVDPIYYVLEENGNSSISTHFVKFRAQTERNSIFQISWKTSRLVEIEEAKSVSYKRQKIRPSMPFQTSINIMYRYTQKCRITIDFDLRTGLSNYIYITDSQAEYKLLWTDAELIIHPWFGTMSPDPTEMIKDFYDNILPQIAGRTRISYAALPPKITFKDEQKWGHDDPFIKAISIVARN